MIASTSFSAFNVVPSQLPLGASPAVQQARAQQAEGSARAPVNIPETRPGLPPPRGSLVNLSV